MFKINVNEKKVLNQLLNTECKRIILLYRYILLTASLLFNYSRRYKLDLLRIFTKSTNYFNYLSFFSLYLSLCIIIKLLRSFSKCTYIHEHTRTHTHIHSKKNIILYQKSKLVIRKCLE